MRTHTMNYKEFKTRCEDFGKKMDVYVDVKYFDLSAYGLIDWYAAYFEVDRFGGIAAEVAFINDNFRYTDDLCGTHIFSTLDAALELVPMAVMDTRERREGVALEEMANID